MSEQFVHEGTVLDPPPAEYAIVEKQYADYWGFEERHSFMLPDGLQYIEYKTMTEGDRQKFAKLTSKELKLNRKDDTATMHGSAGEDRWALLQVAVTGWNIVRKNKATESFEAVPFVNDGKGGTFQQWLQGADPRIVEDLEREVRIKNPWLLGEMTVADIDREIENLQSMRKVAEEREAGNVS